MIIVTPKPFESLASAIEREHPNLPMNYRDCGHDDVAMSDWPKHEWGALSDETVRKYLPASIATAALPHVYRDCGHTVDLKTELQGSVAANYCPVCRAVEAERERCARIADAAAVECLAIFDIAEECREIAERIRSGE